MLGASLAVAVMIGSCGGGVGGSAGGSGGGETCDDLTEPGPGEPSPVGVTLRNDGAATIYVLSSSTCRLEIYQVATDVLDAGQSLGRGGCGRSCGSLLSEDCGLCEGDGACPPDPQVIVLPPGTTYVAETWSGVVLESREIPAECVKFPHCADSCVVTAGAPAGDYVFTAYALPTCTGDPAVCDCPSATESCVTSPGAALSGDSRMVSATIAVPTAAAVELVFP